MPDKNRMVYREFFKESNFVPYATGDSNWDLYLMQYKKDTPILVALAKEGTGASDCIFGSPKHLEKLDWQGIKHGYTRIHENPQH